MIMEPNKTTIICAFQRYVDGVEGNAKIHISSSGDSSYFKLQRQTSFLVGMSTP